MSDRPDEERCLELWLEWRRSNGLADLGKPQRGLEIGLRPDFVFDEPIGRYAVEHTRFYLDDSFPAYESVVRKFFDQKVLPHLVLGSGFGVHMNPTSHWDLRRIDRDSLAGALIAAINQEIDTTGVPHVTGIKVEVNWKSYGMTFAKFASKQRKISVSPSSSWWDSDDRTVDAMVSTIEKKVARNQFEDHPWFRKILLIADHVPTASVRHVRAALERVLVPRGELPFDEVFLIGSMEGPPCQLVWSATSTA